jgi:ADP-heptose:LPS heptosyltransferase
MDKIEIAVRFEGGSGDCLLANRFVAAIKEKYPNSEITAYIDSEGKTFQKEILQLLYGSLYKSIEIIPHKKYKEFWVDCQFGTDNYKGALENVPDSVSEIFSTYDKFYDLHIDSLKWIDYDFDWLRYFRFFPRPDVEFANSRGDYVLFHLISSSSVGHRLEDWYIARLITEVAKNHKCVIISTEDTNKFYDGVANLPNVEIFNGPAEDVCGLISNAKFMISTDSGFRYVAYGYGVPTVTFSANCKTPYSPAPSHMIRWLIFPETCYPLNYDAKDIADICNKIVSGERGYILAPYLQDFNLQAVKRIYTINQDKTRK